jgi:hypothetical protein
MGLKEEREAKARRGQHEQIESPEQRLQAARDELESIRNPETFNKDNLGAAALGAGVGLANGAMLAGLIQGEDKNTKAIRGAIAVTGAVIGALGGFKVSSNAQEAVREARYNDLQHEVTHAQNDLLLQQQSQLGSEVNQTAQIAAASLAVQKGLVVEAGAGRS